MRQLLPEPLDDVDPAALYAADARPAPTGRPWVLVSMASSIDGATAVGGVSGPLGGPADARVFAALRGVADVLLVGASTVRAERYGPPKRRGDRTPPRLAVVTASGDLDPGLRLFAEVDPDLPPPLVLTCDACPADRREALAAVAEVVLAGDDRVDLTVAVATLHELGARIVLAEGGPALNGQLLAAGLVDEWCASFAPVLVGDMSARTAPGGEATPSPLAMRLDRLLVEDDVCFARYVRLTASVSS